MKTETLLLIAGAVGVGFLIAKHRAAKAAAGTPGVAPRIAARALPEEGADIVFVEPAVEYVPYPAWGGGWGPSWGAWGGRGGGGRHHHHHRRH